MKFEHHYVEKGTGFPMVLLHGNGESNEYFEHQIAYFSKMYRVIALDTRGHGKSQRGEKEFTLIQFAEDLKYFLDRKGIVKAIILGFSDGGNIALLFALKYQSYVKALILNAANLHPSGMSLLVHLGIRISYECMRLLAHLDKRRIAQKEMLEIMSHQPNIKPTELNKIQLPVLVIVGTRDMIKRSHTNEIHKTISKSKLVILKGNHFIANKQHIKFNKAVDIFLKNLKIL